MKKKYIQSERGSALLLSLGILSLMLITGTAFVTNALISRKTAFFNSSRNQADFLAKSAINRAQGAVMLYNMLLRQGAIAVSTPTNNDNDFLITDLSSIVSHALNRDTSSNEDVKVSVKLHGNTSDEDPTFVCRDGLSRVSNTAADATSLTAGIFKMLPYVGVGQNLTLNPTTFTYDNAPYYRAENETLNSATPPERVRADSACDLRRSPEWVFVTNGRTGADRRIIGRYAFRVLPPRNRSMINLNSVLHHVSIAQGTNDPSVEAMKNSDFAVLLTKDISTQAETDAGQVTWSLSKLFSTVGIRRPNTTNPDLATDSTYFAGTAAANRDAWFTYLTTSSHNRVGSLERFAAAWTLSTADKRNLMRFFDDSIYPADLEVYDDLQTPRQLKRRFSLAKLNDTALGTNVNTNTAVENLMSTATRSLRGTSNLIARGQSNFSVNTQATELSEQGIPFLARICGETETANFPNITDRRKQIAANLLDYCDTDSKPTSDVDSLSWSVAPSSTYPAYTGNERTAYINEIGLLLQLSAKAVEHATALPELRLPVKARAFMELVDVYQNALTGYSGEMFCNTITFTATVSGHAKATANVTVNEVTTPQSVETDFTNQTVTVSLAADATNEDKTFSFSSFGDRNSGYYAGLSDTKNPLNVSGNTLTATQLFGSTTLPANTTSVTDPEIRITSLAISNIQFAPAAMMISAAGTTAGDTTVSPRDFTKFSGSAISYSGSISPESPADVLPVTTTGSEIPLFSFALGGVECRDPRQNLFLTAANSTGNDWHVTTSKRGGISKLYFVPDDETNLPNKIFSVVRLSSSLDDNADISTIPSLTGKVNTVSNPNAPVNADGNEIASTERDPETVTNPAWITTGSGETATHTHISTAYIRNAPMQSAWELGAIHRGAPWQTINLKRVSVDTTTNNPYVHPTYAQGDGEILDEIKLTHDIRSFGKLNLNDLLENNTILSSCRTAMLNALLRGFAYGVNDYSGTALTPAQTPNYDTLATSLSNQIAAVTDRSEMVNRSEAVRRGMFTVSSTIVPSATTDAAQEELIGKLIPLTKTLPALATSFRVVILAQTIKDAGNASNPTGTVDADRFDKDGNMVTKSVQYGRFDYYVTPTKNNEGTYNAITELDKVNPAQITYFDEITGESWLLATFDRNPLTGAIKLRNVRHLNSVSDYCDNQ